MQKKLSNRDILKEIRRAIELESKALSDVSRALSPDYARAVKLLLACKGKVIVTGMGKSGIIARKIAATFVSTGTPSVYLHAAEGLHGDLGLVGKKDVVLAVAKSGESDELSGILLPIRKIGARIIAITASRDSTLAKYSEAILYTPIEKEACPLNLAPTCSTTAAMAVGDALAVTLMKMRDFKKEHFALLHPGGKLGKQLTLTVEDVMRSGEHNPVVDMSASIGHVLSEITRKRMGAVSVTDKKRRLLGLVTDYDVRKVLEKGENLFEKSVGEIMNPKPAFVYCRQKVVEAMDLMQNRSRPLSLLPVLNSRKKLVGMIHVHDIRAKGL